ncbi:hypothetical protein TNCV_186621 [Trichonephila clavipes]|nr:hypothetical protein TNCV_186621 [Trichonephila clavipes]
MVTVDFLHHENPPTWAEVEPATLGAEGQRQTTHVTQHNDNNDKRIWWQCLWNQRNGSTTYTNMKFGKNDSFDDEISTLCGNRLPKGEGEVNINVALFRYTRAFGDRPRHIEP